MTASALSKKITLTICKGENLDKEVDDSMFVPHIH